MSKSHFGDRQYVVEYLGEALSKRRLTIFLGAGVSRELINSGVAAIGLPDWPNLLARLYAAQGWDVSAGSNYTQQAEDFKNRVMAEGRTFLEFQRLVQQALYEGVDLDFAAIRQNPLVSG
jgi:hypothetical protein